MKSAAFAFVALAVAAIAAAGAGPLLAQDKPIPEMSEEFLNDGANISIGGEIWAEQCTHCHGAKAYPGKAPKLKPSKYTPDFVYHRLTYGFRGMPPWEEVYTEDERKSIVAYILSKQFSP